MMRHLLGVFVVFLCGGALLAENEPSRRDWNQWRGPTRDGRFEGPEWPARLSDGSLKLLWRLPLGSSYSGPIVTEALVYTTETKNKESEIVRALERKTGKERWQVEWKGAMTVPFFAASNGSWIRATPAYDGESLYVAGIRDVLVCLDAQSGKERWRVDFVKQFESPLPTFGYVSSPLVDGDALYVQAGSSVFKLKKKTGEVIWRSLKDQGGMMGSAFSSPVLADLGNGRQLLVQTREKLAGLDPEKGTVQWEQAIPSFRGMNILTPVVVGDTIFTSTYQNKSWLYKLTRENDRMGLVEQWNNNAQGYMSTPVVIDGHVYMHLQNQRFTCIELKTGKRTWTSKPYGKYWSLVAQGNRILALDERGVLLLIKANPREFEVLDEFKVSKEETWAHLAISGREIYIREKNAIAAYLWDSKDK